MQINEGREKGELMKGRKLYKEQMKCRKNKGMKDERQKERTKDRKKIKRT
jgi:hypothetical protein